MRELKNLIKWWQAGSNYLLTRLGSASAISASFSSAMIFFISTGLNSPLPNSRLNLLGPGMTPPLGLALATSLRKRLFTDAERQNGKAAYLLGASFISEGAIPFAAVDPLRVIPASMVGGAVTGAISMAAGVTSQAPHGGIFVFFAIGNLGMWALAIVAGTVVSALVLVLLKKFVRRSTAAGADASADAAEAGSVVGQRSPVAA